MANEPLLDVIAVDLTTNRVRLIAENKTALKVEAIVEMAVMCRGAVAEFYTTVPPGEYADGDTWKGNWGHHSGE